MAKVWSECSLFPHAGALEPSVAESISLVGPVPTYCKPENHSWVGRERKQEWVSFLQGVLDPDTQSALVSASPIWPLSATQTGKQDRQDTWPVSSLFVSPLETLHRGGTRTRLYNDWLHTWKPPVQFWQGCHSHGESNGCSKQITDALVHRPPFGSS